MSVQYMRYRAYLQHIRRDVLTVHPVTTGSGTLQLPIAVNDRNSQSVEFGLSYVFEVEYLPD